MDEQLVDDATELAQVLRAAEVDASLLERFAEEALTLRLLRDMGDRLSSNLEELGMCAADATHLATVILARGGREGGRASSPVVVAQGTAVSEASSRVAAIQQSLFADDVPPPDDADKCAPPRNTNSSSLWASRVRAQLDERPRSTPPRVWPVCS